MKEGINVDKMSWEKKKIKQNACGAKFGGTFCLSCFMTETAETRLAVLISSGAPKALESLDVSDMDLRNVGRACVVGDASCARLATVFFLSGTYAAGGIFMSTNSVPSSGSCVLLLRW